MSTNQAILVVTRIIEQTEVQTSGSGVTSNLIVSNAPTNIVTTTAFNNNNIVVNNQTSASLVVGQPQSINLIANTQTSSQVL